MVISIMFWQEKVNIFYICYTVYTTCSGQPTSLGQRTMWPQNTSNLLDNLHACFYIP